MMRMVGHLFVDDVVDEFETRGRTNVDPGPTNDFATHLFKLPLHKPRWRCRVGGQSFERLELCQSTLPGTSTPRTNVTAASWHS
eukprot:4812844-Pyramimonas_sp.AAC.1